MPGFNYGGGKGDGTGWSSERGNEPSPGGGSKGNAGNHDKGKGSTSGKGSGTTPGISRSVGDALALKAGLNPGDFTGYFINADGNAIGISPLVGGDAFGVNLGPAPANPAVGGGNSGNGNSANTLNPFNAVIVTFKGDTSDARIAALNKIIADNARMANSGQAGQRIRNAVKATKQAKAELALINAARKQKAAKQAAEARAKAEAAAKTKAEAEARAKADAAAKTKAEAEARAKTEAAAKAKVEAEARAKAEAAAKAQREAATNRLRSASVQAVRGVEIGTPASTAPASWAIASAGAITLGEDVAGSLLSRISAVLTELRGIAAASLAGPVAATLAGLLYSEKVGVGSDVVPGRDISALLSADILSLPDASALLRAADAGTPIDMAVRGRLVVRDDGTLETQLVRSKVPGKVQVVRAVQDSVTGYWGVTLPKVADVQGPTILVSPVNQPGAGSATLTDPVPVPEQITHFGGPVTVPQGPTVLITPVAEPPGIHDIILVFPPESGLKPQYIIYNSPYGETNAKGKYSGRDYNKDKAGGPIQNLDWKEATIDRAGVDKVKLHAGRFGESPDNKVMIERLEKILTGELQVTDTDKRYYTHEIRELERYRNLGVKDGTLPESVQEKKSVWNNTHTATLEDYKINEREQTLYTDAALQAAYEQELKDAFKGDK